MARYSYMIGSAVNNLEYLENLVSTMCVGRFELSPVRYVGADGRTYGDGRPIAVWHFDLISQDDLNTLRGYLSSGSTYLMSAPVYIKTRMDNGSFSTFSAIMHWPENMGEKRVTGNYYRDVDIEFTALQQVIT